MQLEPYVESLHDHLVGMAETGGADSSGVIERLVRGLDPAVRLVLLETLSAVAAEITAEIAPGAVEVRLRGSDPDFVVTLPSAAIGENAGDGRTQPRGTNPMSLDDGATSRLNLRLPAGLKARVEESARREGLSLNAWFVRTAAAAVEDPREPWTGTPGASQRYTGWVR